MACHHGVEGPCPPCEATRKRKAETPPTPRLLHIERESGGPLCGGPLDQEDRFSTLNTHEESRFCRLCLIEFYDTRSLENEARLAAWQNRPFSEKRQAFHDRLLHPSDYDKIPMAFFGCLTLALLLAVGIGTYVVSQHFDTTAIVTLGTLFGLWRFAVSRS